MLSLLQCTAPQKTLRDQSSLGRDLCLPQRLRRTESSWDSRWRGGLPAGDLCGVLIRRVPAKRSGSFTRTDGVCTHGQSGKMIFLGCRREMSNCWVEVERDRTYVYKFCTEYFCIQNWKPKRMWTGMCSAAYFCFSLRIWASQSSWS